MIFSTYKYIYVYVYSTDGDTEQGGRDETMLRKVLINQLVRLPHQSITCVHYVSDVLKFIRIFAHK